MTKKRTFLILTIILINFCACNFSFAATDTELKNVYPDFSYEYTGKDSCEKFNRKLFVFNLKLNKYLIRPVNIVWASTMPKYGMDRLQNLYNNINYPTRLMGCVFQKDFESAGHETLRFITNTTIGIGGLYDPALNKFKLEPRQEDMEQVLANTKMKKGPYLVLPVVQGNLRDLFGRLLNCPLRPTSYVGPFGAAAGALFTINNSTYTQPMVKKADETCADPYELSKQVDGIQTYIKDTNLDRKKVFEEKTSSQNITAISNIYKTPNIKPDIQLTNFNPQGSLVDSMRTAMFDNQKIDSSIWSEMSIWNKTFGKKLKIASVNITPNRQNYRYRYILQKNKTSPLAILYPSIGEGIMADKSVILGKLLYDEGYSVVIMGSAFNWEFIKSMPEGYKPGIPAEDAKNLRLTTAKIIDNLQTKKKYNFSKKTIVGCSFGALTGLFATAQDNNAEASGEKPIGITNCIAINPPIETFFALEQLDKYTQDWKKDPSDIKLRTAIAAEKIILVSKNICRKNVKEMPENMPFTDDEAKLIVGFIMKQKLYDVVFAINNCSRGKQSHTMDAINKMSYYNYAQEYLGINQIQNFPQLERNTSLYAITDFLKNNNNYKIYHTLDDYFVNQEQLIWLKKTSKNKSIFFSNGSHLGFMYRQEFVDEFKKDIKVKTGSSTDKI